ncbi:MAG: helix-turn-helix domain-containing protein [Candidatus Magasanikbacteria bacterium]
MPTSHLETTRRNNKQARVLETKNYLTFYEIEIIEVRIRAGWSMRRIADYLYRLASTICGEVNRNSNKHDFYTAKETQRMYEDRKNK